MFAGVGNHVQYSTALGLTSGAHSVPAYTADTEVAGKRRGALVGDSLSRLPLALGWHAMRALRDCGSLTRHSALAAITPVWTTLAGSCGRCAVYDRREAA